MVRPGRKLKKAVEKRRADPKRGTHFEEGGWAGEQAVINIKGRRRNSKRAEKTRKRSKGFFGWMVMKTDMFVWPSVSSDFTELHWQSADRRRNACEASISHLLSSFTDAWGELSSIRMLPPQNSSLMFFYIMYPAAPPAHIQVAQRRFISPFSLL